VRAWGLSSGALLAQVTLEGAVGADRQIRGSDVVQCVAVCGAGGLPRPASRIAAACGRTIFALRLALCCEAEAEAEVGVRGRRLIGDAGAQLVAAPPRSALPSMIVDLAFVAAQGGAGRGRRSSDDCVCCLAAATTAAGVFLWLGEAGAAAAASF
jgi:hypothetical protein